ncbi:NBS-LRR type resistance protein [Striga asiatica]|uniref:NBS-LRR type resistance protein n=1 Tax=Striga asiatica TaxID=4170 RepID=A0A5A7R4C5_STRAF|nr:NBS-LRR type resistance protein [Striga asiatica]
MGKVLITRGGGSAAAPRHSDHCGACFLYFGIGMFSEDYEIPVWKLIRMWIAEGFIQQKTDRTLEETAESYLEELISRNLIRVEKRNPNGKVKTCLIHDMLREFCKTKAGNEGENFLQEIKKSSEGCFYPLVCDLEKYRRLCIHSDVVEFVSSKPLYGHRIRSMEPRGPGHHFPRLRRLELKNCVELGEIPIGLADVPSLKLLDVYCCRSAAGSAKRIREAILKKKQEDQTQVGGEGMFKLTIFPPDALDPVASKYVLRRNLFRSDINKKGTADGSIKVPIFIFCRHGCPHPASSSFLINTVAHLHDLRRDGEKSLNELVARIYRPRLKFRCPIYDGCDDGVVVGDGAPYCSVRLTKEPIREFWAVRSDSRYAVKLGSIHTRRGVNSRCNSARLLAVKDSRYRPTRCLILFPCLQKELHGAGPTTVINSSSYSTQPVAMAMADAAIEFLLENLKQLLLTKAELISSSKSQVERLEKDLCLFNAFLKDSTKKRRKDLRLRELVRQIRDVVYEAEDVIDAFVTQAADTKSKNYFLRSMHKPLKLMNIVEQVEGVRAKVNEIYGSDKSLIDFSTGDENPDEVEEPIVRQKNVAGFEDEAEKIIGYLNEKTEQLDVISIIGMPGLGKTTLAGKIFRDRNIQFEFPTRIWVYISQEFTKKDIFLAILKEFTRITEDIYNKSDRELAQLVASHLERRKFLIVMDDVWTANDWDKLQIALPKGNKMGKVLITSRHEEVAQYANRDRPPHKLRFLTQDEGWELRQLEVFGKRDCPSDLGVFGKLIVNQCCWLPLAIVIIGGILVKRFSSSDSISVKWSAWEKVSENVHSYLTEEDPEKRMVRIIAMSYDKLPYHLRACFLYFGMFPEDYEIPVWKLIRMWIAEGFIQQKTDHTLEETAESYLEELISRNLIRVEKRKLNGKVKTCLIHNKLREFCKSEAGNEGENFLQEIKKSSEGCFYPRVCDLEKYRRLCIHSDVVEFVSSKLLYGHRIRSFACFSKEEINLPASSLSNIPSAFKLLRVLEAKPMKFTKIPSELYQLFHLRYITLSSTSPTLPSYFAKFWNLQTLVVDTPSRTLDIKVDIWKMTQLRHIKTNASASLPAPKAAGKEGEKLQTLGFISPQSCTEEILNRARNLKSLGIRGRLDMLLEGKVGPASEGQLRVLPQHYKFPPKLRSLTLSETFLEWSQMSTLGLLDSLEVLKLKDGAFKGKHWEAADGGFRRLEVLFIGPTDLVVWKVSGHHFPRLKRLELKNCEELGEIPIGLADVPSLQLLDVYRCRSAAGSARRIREAILKKKQEDQTQVGGEGMFKLTIFPPDAVRD